jgi:hypothetical protein
VDADNIIDPSVQMIMNARIVKHTWKNYDDSNTRLICWLYDSCDTYLYIVKPTLLANLVIADQDDSTRRNKDGSPSKARTFVNAVIHDALQNIVPEDPSTHPIHLEKLNFNVVGGI